MNQNYELTGIIELNAARLETLTFWLMIGCGLDEQPFNFMGRKLFFNLPKNSFSNAKYANGLIKWHKLCHMIPSRDNPLYNISEISSQLS